MKWLRPTFSLMTGVMIGLALSVLPEHSIAQTNTALPATPAYATPVAPAYLPRYQPNIPPVTERVFERVPGPDTPTLQALAADAADDAVLIDRVVTWYADHRDTLRTLWRIDDETRLAAVYSMYIVHISHVYGEATMPPTLTDYLALDRSHCGLYSVVQAEILDGLGIPWRMLGLTNGWHGWIEVQVAGEWEIFDSTINVWISRDGFALEAGAVREFRNFYTPLLDINRPDARLHESEGYNLHNLRTWMPGLGLFYMPPATVYLMDESQ
jgi:hypothetical protein